MKIQQLIYFCAVCRNRNFRLAAKELGVAQPTLSAALRRLEEEFGLELFVRSRRGFSLTAAGSYFLECAEPVVADFQEICEELRLMAERKNMGTLAAPPAIFPLLIQAGVLGAEAGLPVKCVEWEPEQAGTMPDADVILQYHWDVSVFRGITAEPLFQEAMVYVSCGDLPTSQDAPVPLSSIAHLPVILYTGDRQMYQYLAGYLGAGHMESSQLDSVCAVVAQKYYSTVLPARLVHLDIPHVAVPLAELPPLTVYAVQGKGSSREMFDKIVGRLKELVAPLISLSPSGGA